MAWHIRQRMMWLSARVALLCNQFEQAATLARGLIDDAEQRGSMRYSVLGRHTVSIAQARRPTRASITPPVDALVDDLRRQASLDSWWLILDLADSLGDPALVQVARADAERLLDEVATCSSLDLGRTTAWIADRFAESPHSA
jgi:hypothetical protein